MTRGNGSTEVTWHCWSNCLRSHPRTQVRRSNAVLVSSGSTSHNLTVLTQPFQQGRMRERKETNGSPKPPERGHPHNAYPSKDPVTKLAVPSIGHSPEMELVCKVEDACTSPFGRRVCRNIRTKKLLDTTPAPPVLEEADEAPPLADPLSFPPLLPPEEVPDTVLEISAMPRPKRATHKVVRNNNFTREGSSPKHTHTSSSHLRHHPKWIIQTQYCKQVPPFFGGER